MTATSNETYITYDQRSYIIILSRNSDNDRTLRVDVKVEGSTTYKTLLKMVVDDNFAVVEGV